jgi:hypothetical protein
MLKCIWLTTNTKQTQAMVCTPGNIRVQLPTNSYRHMCEGVAAGEESKQAVVCHMGNKTLQARSLCLHLSSAHDIHQQMVVAEALLEKWTGAQVGFILCGTVFYSTGPKPIFVVYTSKVP